MHLLRHTIGSVFYTVGFCFLAIFLAQRLAYANGLGLDARLTYASYAIVAGSVFGGAISLWRAEARHRINAVRSAA